jgi:hypothetical protein
MERMEISSAFSSFSCSWLLFHLQRERRTRKEQYYSSNEGKGNIIVVMKERKKWAEERKWTPSSRAIRNVRSRMVDRMRDSNVN